MKKRVDNPAPPIQLYAKRESGEYIANDIWVCGECKTLNTGMHTKEAAGNCCKKRLCKCGKELPEYWTSCSDCLFQKREAKMEEVEYDGGWLCELDGDRFFTDMDEVLDYYHDYDKDEHPEFMHPCEAVKWGGLDEADIEDAIVSSLDEHYEDAYDQVVDLDELVAHVKKWNEKQTIVSYHPIAKQKVKVNY